MPISYIALGTNLGDRLENLRNALALLHQPAKIDLQFESSIYETKTVYKSKPLPGMEQPDFLNMVVQIKTTLTPEELLVETRSIEKQLLRDHSAAPWSARIIDLDILLYNDLQLDTDDLTIPHYAMHDRNFVLYPLLEIAPELLLPSGKTVSGLWREKKLDIPHCYLSLEEIYAN